MAINPKRVAMQVALRAMQLAGKDQATLETAYNLGYAALDGADIPLSSIIDTCLAAEAELAEIIANDAAHPYRKFLAARSEDLQNGDEIPTTDEDAIKWIGVFTGVNDASDEMPLTTGTIQQIQRFRRSSPSRYTTDIRLYKIFNGRLYHTRTRAYIDGCSWSRNAAYNRFAVASTSLSPLPISLEGTWIARALELSASEDWFVAEGQYYGNVAQTGIARLKMRSLDLPTLPDQTGAAGAAAN